MCALIPNELKSIWSKNWRQKKWLKRGKNEVGIWDFLTGDSPLRTGFIKNSGFFADIVTVVQKLLNSANHIHYLFLASLESPLLCDHGGMLYGFLLAIKVEIFIFEIACFVRAISAIAPENYLFAFHDPNIEERIDSEKHCDLYQTMKRQKWVIVKFHRCLFTPHYSNEDEQTKRNVSKRRFSPLWVEIM